MSEDESSWTDFQNEDDGDPVLLDPDGGADSQRRCNHISALHIDGDEWCSDQQRLAAVAVAYYQKLFTREVFSHVLPPYVLLHIAAISPPILTFLSASIAWNCEASGRFSIRSAYKLCLGELTGEEDPRFLSIPIREWILENLRSPVRFANADNWELLFGAVLWNIWLTRNAAVFNSPSLFPTSIIHSSISLMECMMNASSAVRGGGRTVCTTSAPR
ncbi:hypothetical protein V6N13_123984 [Hibiscus sabdariffa]